MEKEQIQEIKKEIGKNLNELRKQSHITTYTTFNNINYPSHIVNSVISGNKNYKIETLLNLLAEVKKTIQIVDL
jgi:hypothetical protein